MTFELMSLRVAVSARHVHLDTETLEHLFGPGYTLTVLKELSQPGQFAANETVTVVGPKGRLEDVRVLGPLRARNQIELSTTDAYTIGVSAPVRQSGDVAGSAAVTLEGPAGVVDLSEGAVCAWRHLHMTPEDAERFGVSDKDLVEVAIDSAGRDLVFGDVMVRVSSKYASEMHIDTDEANAAGVGRGTEGALVETHLTARIRPTR